MELSELYPNFLPTYLSEKGNEVKMIAVIMQPTYLPWIGYFDLIDEADTFVFLDNVQFEKQSWQQRNRVKTSNAWPLISPTSSSQPPVYSSEPNLSYSGSAGLYATSIRSILEPFQN